MLYDLVVTLGLLSFALNLLFNLRVIKRPKVEGATLIESPLVSILIPARDEEGNIEACIQSLQQQDYPNFEIIVLDDNSSDSTASIVQKMMGDDNRTQLIRGEKLPKDWAGKPFACFQLAKKAKGDWLLFVDADTTHSPDMLSSVMTTALKTNCSLLSGFPRQETVTIAEKAIIPLVYFIILSWMPLWLIIRAKKPRSSIAIGQFLLFSKTVYWQFGGHEAVKSKILDDIWLGIEVSRQGGRHVVLNLSSVVSCRMYHNLQGVWHGLIKCIYSVAKISSLALISLIIVAAIFFLLPFYSLWNLVFGMTYPWTWQFLIFSQLTLIFSMRWIIDRKFKEPLISPVLHPFGIGLLIIMVSWSILHRVSGRQVRWKKRMYGGRSSIH